MFGRGKRGKKGKVAKPPPPPLSQYEALKARTLELSTNLITSCKDAKDEQFAVGAVTIFFLLLLLVLRKPKARAVTAADALEVTSATETLEARQVPSSPARSSTSQDEAIDTTPGISITDAVKEREARTTSANTSHGEEETKEPPSPPPEQMATAVPSALKPPSPKSTVSDAEELASSADLVKAPPSPARDSMKRVSSLDASSSSPLHGLAIDPSSNNSEVNLEEHAEEPIATATSPAASPNKPPSASPKQGDSASASAAGAASPKRATESKRKHSLLNFITGRHGHSKSDGQRTPPPKKSPKLKGVVAEAAAAAAGNAEQAEKPEKAGNAEQVVVGEEKGVVTPTTQVKATAEPEVVPVGATPQQQQQQQQLEAGVATDKHEEGDKAEGLKAAEVEVSAESGPIDAEKDGEEEEAALSEPETAVPDEEDKDSGLFERIALSINRGSPGHHQQPPPQEGEQDAAATRASQKDEFDVVFTNDGPMRLTLEMDQAKHTVVATLELDSEAARSGVLVGDRVVLVDGKPAGTYGSVLGHLNMSARPLTITFRKREVCEACESDPNDPLTTTTNTTTNTTTTNTATTVATTTADAPPTTTTTAATETTADHPASSSSTTMDPANDAPTAVLPSSPKRMAPLPPLKLDLLLDNEDNDVRGGGDETKAEEENAGDVSVAAAAAVEVEAQEPLKGERPASQRFTSAVRSNSFARLFGSNRGSLSKEDGAAAGSPLANSPAHSTVTAGGGGGGMFPPLSRRDSSRSRVPVELAASEDSFEIQMSKGVVVTKYSRGGKGAQRALYYDEETKSVAWREPLSSSTTNKRANSLSRLVKGEREALPLASLRCVVAGYEQDPEANDATLLGTAQLRSCCCSNAALLDSSFAMLFGERSLEISAANSDHVKTLVEGFRALAAEVKAAE